MSLETEAHLPSSGFDPRGPSVPKTRHSIQIPRISEIPETQDVLQESIEIDHMRIEPLDLDRQPFQISQRTMDCSKCFSKAVQQLESPDIGPHTVTRRRSRRELGQEASGSPIMPGIQRGFSTWHQYSSFRWGREESGARRNFAVGCDVEAEEKDVKSTVQTAIYGGFVMIRAGREWW